MSQVCAVILSWVLPALTRMRTPAFSTCLLYLPLLLSTCVISARDDFSISPLAFRYLKPVNILIKKTDYSVPMCLEGDCPVYNVRLA